MDAAEEMVMDEQQKEIGAGAGHIIPAQPPGRQGPSYPTPNPCPPGTHEQIVNGVLQCVSLTGQLFPRSNVLGAGATLPGTAEAQVLVAAYPGACTNPLPGGAFYDAVKAFKIAYNIGINGGDTSGPNGDGPSSTAGYLQHDGNYDQATADAVTACLGSAPAACAASGTPQQNNNPPQNNTVVASTGWPMWLKIVLWIIALGGAVGLGLYLYKTFGSSSPSRAGESKRKKMGKRTSKKR